VTNCFIRPSIIRLRSPTWYLPSRQPAWISSNRLWVSAIDVF